MGEGSNNLLVTAEDLCRIIAICAKSGVRQIKIGALSMEFGARDKSFKPLNVAETKPSEQEIEKINNEAFDQEMAARDLEERENLKLLNPLAYERLLEGEINDVGSPP